MSATILHAFIIMRLSAYIDIEILVLEVLISKKQSVSLKYTLNSVLMWKSAAIGPKTEQWKSDGLWCWTFSFPKEHTTVPITVFSCLSEPVEQFEVSHQAQLVWWQWDLADWNSLDAEQEPKRLWLKGKVNQTCVEMKQGWFTLLPHCGATPTTLLLNALLLCALLT